MIEAPVVLIAEDVKPVRLKLEHMVAELGFESLSVTDGEQALVEFSKSRPGVVLLDISMPVVDGIEVCRRIRQLSAETLIVMVTADGRPSVVREAVAAGANDFITKPFNTERVSASLGKLLNVA